jgi:predicted nucleotidyltransferase
MNLKDVLGPIDALLRKHGVRYAVVGGYALAAWGEVRATRDIDLLCSAQDLNTLEAALRESNLGFEHRVGDYEDPISDVIRVNIDTAGTPYEIDFLAGIRGAPADLWDRTRVVQLQGLDLPVASPEDIIVLKVLAGSSRDLEDARSIVQTQGKKLERTLVIRLCPGELRHICESILAGH